ncbi:M23 family metallopeptidase [Alteromonas sp. 5E99-2]|uniref:M23 family metallopeptidase n=1 Tax=Alteromonas sp. 5E99-2 TaxID=2817683 RepID=UPI001A99E590|nr:M23 family metallopeptidase [Alteromonas sp. 5E99-2]MBO1255538.1 M23 family metallopeptidase [Alteromonas sp. 5E99-2]
MTKLIPVLIFFITACSHAFASEIQSGEAIRGQSIQGSLLRGKVEAGSSISHDGKSIPVSKDGDFVFGFSRDTTKAVTLVVVKDNKETLIRLTPEVREYRIQRIDGLEQSKVTPPVSVSERIRNDAVIVRKARSEVSSLNGFKQEFIWPSVGPISGVYGSQRVLNGKPSWPHFGVDVAAPTGTPVVAPAEGKVTLAHADLYYSGGTIIIDHGMGVFSTFLHLSKLSVSVGDVIKQGDKIGEIGETGRATGPHLDWRINWRNVRLDPALLVPAREGLDYTSNSE